MELCLTGRRTGRSGKSLLRLTLPAPAAPPKEVPQRFLADRLKSLIEAWSRVVTSLEANLEATPLAAPSLPYMKRSPQVSHEASNDRTWPRESRRQRAVCPVTDQGARFEGHYVPRRNPATPGIETGEKPMRSLPLAASANGVWFGQLCCTEKYRGHISGVLVACHGSGDRGVPSTPGADAHASAVAVLLELAQRLRTTQTENACSLCRLLRLSQRSLGVADRPNRGADGCSKSAQGSSSFR